MARYIDATAAQRLHQYTLPQARKDVAEAPAHIATLKADIARLWAERGQHDLATYERRRGTRRVRGAIEELRNYQRHIDWSANLIATYGAAKAQAAQRREVTQMRGQR